MLVPVFAGTGLPFLSSRPRFYTEILDQSITQSYSYVL